MPEPATAPSSPIRARLASTPLTTEQLLAAAQIFIVDDEMANIALLEQLLARGGYTNVRSAQDPRTVPALFDALQPDLILLDLHMPHLDGLALLGEIAARTPKDTYLPVLVLSGDATSTALQSALAAGAKDFVTRPFDMNEVLLRIRNLLQTRFLHQSLQTRNREVTEAAAQAVSGVMADLVARRDVTVVAERIAFSVCTLLQAQAAGVYQIDPATDDLVALAIAGEMPIAPGHRFPKGAGIGGLAIQSGRPAFTHDVGGDPTIDFSDEVRTLLRDSPLHAALAVPLAVQGRIIGSLTLFDEAGRIFTPEHVNVAQAFADQAAIALEMARVYDETERARQTAEELARVAKSLTETLDVAAIGEQVVAAATSLFQAQKCTLRLLEPGNVLRLIASGGPLSHTLDVPLDLPANMGVPGLMLREGKAFWTPDPFQDPRIVDTPELREQFLRSEFRAVLAVPLRVQGVLKGVLAIADRVGRRFADREVELLQILADQAAVALENARHYQAVRDSEERMRLIVETALDAVVTIDATGRVTSWSPHAEAMFGWSHTEIIGARLSETIVPERYRASHEEGMRRFLATGVGPALNKRIELSGLHRDGHEFPIELSITALRAGATVTFSGFIRDLSERKRAEVEKEQMEGQLRQAQKLESIGRLAGGLAHDFNNLLTVIIGRVALELDRVSPDAPVRKSLTLISATAQRAATLTRQLLAFSRKQVLTPRVLDLSAVVTGIEPIMRRLIGEDVTVVVDHDPHLGRIKADPGQMEQVILNLAINARDAMPDGGELLIKTWNTVLGAGDAVGVEPGPYVTLAVTDTGVGMTPDVLSHIFEPFFTTKGPGKGTGLGLATVFGIVKQSGGHVTVESQVGKGATFTAYLPRTEEEMAAGEARGVAVPPARGNETILLAEDDDDVRELAHEILGAEGYTVLAAPSGAEALRLAEAYRNEISLLITDVVMPVMSGAELARRLVTTRPDLRVLFISGYLDEVATRSVREDGTPLVNKPFTPGALVQKVRELLDRSPASLGARRATTPAAEQP